MEPAVSVIMPVRNGGAFLKTAVESILGQSFTSLELILVDDHSDDSSIVRLCLGDSRLRVIKNTGSGVSSAFNTGSSLVALPCAPPDIDRHMRPRTLTFRRRAISPSIHVPMSSGNDK